MFHPRPGRTSLDEFEQLLAASDKKLELVYGDVLAFVGGSVAHGILCARLVSVVHAATKPPGQTFTSDVAVRIDAAGSYVFPDVSHTCEDLNPNASAIRAPDLVIEVISPESQARDRMEKFDVYTSIASVMEYVLVDSRKMWVHLHRRGPAGVWTEATYGPGGRFDLLTVGLVLDVDELYAGTGRIIGGPAPGM